MRIAPSILAVWDKSGNDPKACAKAAKLAEKSGADWLHLDIMDGQFVAAKTFDHTLVAQLKKATKLPLDVHLMVQNPEEVIPDVIAAGATHITFHPTATANIQKCLELIFAANLKAGLGLNIGEPVELLQPYLSHLDQVLVMTVPAGAGGQPFHATELPKIAAVKALLGNKPTDIIADGGINPQTAPLAARAGATVLVAGSAIFNSASLQGAISALAA